MSSPFIKEYYFSDLDSDDVDEWLHELELSFDIRFEGNELQDIRSLSELTEHIIRKLNLENVQDCTSQQAFYKLRKAIAKITSVDFREIKPETRLESLFPFPKLRREEIRKLKAELEIELDLFTPSDTTQFAFGISMVLLIAGLFIQPQIVIAFIFALIILWLIVAFTTKRFRVQTMRELAALMSREHYRASRSNPKSMNREEIAELLRDWYLDYFGLK